MKSLRESDGAGEGNRTLVFSLEGCCSTIELHPRAAFYANPHRTWQWLIEGGVGSLGSFD